MDGGEFVFCVDSKPMAACRNARADRCAMGRCDPDSYAKQTTGFFTRVAAKIAAFTMMQYFNFLNGKPIGRVKYASF